MTTIASAQRNQTGGTGIPRTIGRAAVAALGLLIISYPIWGQASNVGLFAQAMIYGIIGLSLNLLIGYAGQISLGHNAFVGVGAFAAAALTADQEVPMYLSIPLAAIIGALTASILGAVALRIQGLYLALITLAYGLAAQRSIFEIEFLTGGGAGKLVFRPDPFKGDAAYAYVCMFVLGLVLYMDWRMMRSKFGRALLALKSSEQVGMSLGMNPVFYKMSAFILAGGIAGLAGGMLAFRQQAVAAQDFVFFTAITYVIMVVVGGLGSRFGVVIGSAFVFYLPFLLDSIGRSLFSFSEKFDIFGVLEFLGRYMPVLKLGIPGLLLLLTIVQFPGGIAQQVRPITDWLAGKPFALPHGKRRARRAEKRRQAYGIAGSDPTASEPGRIEAEELL